MAAGRAVPHDDALHPRRREPPRRPDTISFLVRSPMSLTSEQIGHLVTAMLAVNGFGTDRAAALLPAFQTRGLLDAPRAAGMDRDALIAAMTDAGYARGGFLPILWYRHQQLMEAVSKGLLDGLPTLASAGREAEFKTKLAAVHGWGPVTAATAWSLWRAQTRR